MADIGNIVCNDDASAPLRTQEESFLDDAEEEPPSTEQEIDVELAVYAKGETYSLVHFR